MTVRCRRALYYAFCISIVGFSGLTGCTVDTSVQGNLGARKKPVASVVNVSVAEGGAAVPVVLSVSKVSSSDIVLNYNSVPGSATDSVDYATYSGLLTIAAGATSVTMTVASLPDGVYEGDETFSIEFSSPSVAGSSAFSSVVTIVDDDTPPTVDFASASGTVYESSGVHFVAVDLSAASPLAVTVNFLVSGTASIAGGDYTLSTTALTFAPGDISKTLSVTLLRDSSVEGDETIVFDIDSVVGGATENGAAVHTLTLHDDRAPVLAAIADETVAEGSAIAVVNTNDGGDDFDADGDTITYVCYYDTVVDGSVASTNACATLTGVNFAAGSGVLTWTPDYSQAGAYEFSVTGSEGDLSDDEIFVITVNNTDRAPVLAMIADQTVSENSALAAVNANDGVDDLDADGDVITYTCYYDATVDGSVPTTNACGTLSGVSFTAATGAFGWTPDYSQAGVYEFMIVGDEGNLTDDEIFAITVNNTDRAPVLAAIGDETVAENTAITALNANDGGDDFDADGDAITYTCYYDMTVDGSVATTNACGILTGLSFTGATGAMTWTPDYTHAGVYEFSIVGDEGNLTDNEIFVITVNNVDRAPVLAAISDEGVSENVAMTQVNANDGGDDFDVDLDAITYSCYYDSVVDGAVATTTACTGLAGVLFDSGTGVMNWTPSYTQAGSYEFRIIGDEGDMTDDELFVITVSNMDRAPVLAAIADETVGENSAIASVDANDNGADADADGDVITYTCYYDTAVDGSVATTSACTTLSGVSFAAATGVMNWTPSYAQSGTYEFRIIGDEGDLTDDEYFSIAVNNVDQPPVLAAIADETVAEGAAITQVNANDGGDDFDSDNDAITYSCYYDTAVDGSVATTTSCATLSGVTFVGATGVLDWTTGFSMAGQYEFRIIGSEGDLTDDEFFVITVTNTDLAPVLAAIADETVSENSAIAAIDANDAGDDLDADGDVITYSCFYDGVIDGNVAEVATCASLSGVSFAAATGTMSWTPSYTQSGVYEFKMKGDEGDLTDTEIFVITVSNSDRAPVLDLIADETVGEASPITLVNAADGLDDFDIDGDAITYACYYDMAVDGSVATTNACTTLAGVSFTAGTGAMSWTPDYAQAGVYEFRVIGDEGDLTDDEFFVITVSNVDRAPVLAAIADESVGEGSAITAVNANDAGDDLDADSDVITYTCYYDTAVDGAVATTNACGTLTGVTFTGATGAMTWTPSFAQMGSYEFRVIGDEGDLTDDELFVITVTNTDLAPVLAAIADEAVSENAAISAIDANDGGDDLDADGDVITYTCYYDMVVDGAVATTNACGTLTGVSFTGATGVMNWTPDYSQAGSYEFRIIGDEGNLTDDEIFVITVGNTDRAPVLAAIGDETVGENVAIAAVNANDGGDDFDVDNDAITYVCYYDNVVDGSVAATNACGTLAGVSFTAGTGTMTWTPDYSQAGSYEFSIIGSEGDLSDDELFVITVTNTDRSPVLAAIADETVAENAAMTSVDANDGGDDADADGDVISYTCYYDITVDGAVATTNACGTLTGVSFTAGTGAMTWTPSFTQNGVYEFKIIGDEGDLSDDELFVITVTNTDRAPILDAIANETVAEGAAMTLVNAADGLDDFDVDGDAITYVCYYDNTNDGSVASTNACGTLTGVSFTAGTGVIAWTPDYTQNGTYEFRVTGSEGDLTDDELFVITVTNTDRAPALAAIADETVGENSAIASVDANDGGDDFDVDSDAITYTCYYDMVVDGAVATTSACGTLAGVSFAGATGAMTWTPSFSQNGVYEFSIIGSEGDLSDDELFVITVTNTDQAPLLAAIADETVAEGVAITQVNANDGGDDFDADNDAITYTCFYDMTVDGAVAAATACGTLSGVSFAGATGVMDWTPGLSMAGQYEFRITGDEGDLTDDEIFVITVSNTDQAPVLAAIADETVNENAAITAVNANDGGDDFDADNDAITYTCYYDMTADGNVASTNACGTLAGVSFTGATGAMTWTPSYAQSGVYEFKMIGDEGDLTDDEIFVVTVTNVDRAPVLAVIADETVAENAAITAVNANDGGDDADADGDVITYQCWYDTAVDGAVAATTACTTLSGTLFDTGTGVFNWTPDYTQSGSYEFRIVGSEGDLSDDEIFVITVTNTDRAPVLAAIADETVAENAAISAVNANDGGDDFDADSDPITYTCYYDMTVDGAVATTNACGTLTGVSFTAGTGAMTWTPDYAQAGVYEFSIVGDEGNLTDDEIFVITVTNTDRAPVLAAIADESVAENAAITALNANDGGDDFDADNDAITYACYYDMTVDGAVATTNACGTLSGVSFTAGTGVMTWTPDYAQAGVYEFSIVGDEGNLTDDEIFVITVTNTDRAPVLAAIADESVAENAAITAVNANDGGDDFDADNDAITYTCYYDMTVDGAVATTNACGTLSGVSFTAGTGTMTWTPDYAQAGTYEFSIIGDEGNLTDDEIFVITVTNTDRAPVLAAIADESVAENAAITAVNANDGGDDFDADNDAITYTCYYDMTVDGAVAAATACGTLTGVSFTAGTGAMTWTPDFAQAGVYEFSIIGDEGNLTDDEIFVITVTNTDRAPVLAAIGNETVGEAAAIAQVNANDGGDDQDADGDNISYSCYYDTTFDGSVAAVTACSTLAGVSFAGATGIMDWTPNYTQSGVYEFSIIGDEGNLTDDELFVITVTNTDQAPVLAAIGDETVAEGNAITGVNANDGGDDFDADNDAITYTCYYDTTVDGSVAATTACTSLSGVSFVGATGVMTWTPGLSTAGQYEFSIIGSEGNLTDDELFVITVTNTDQPPVLAAIGNQAVNENAAIAQVDANDGGDDLDADSDTITYSCYYDTSVDSAVASVTACTVLTGVSFAAATGVMDWTPSYAQSGVYEFKIVADEGDLTDYAIFTITVTNVDRAPVLAAIGNQTVNENAAITQINANDGGDDFDAGNDAITYQCWYDSTVDAAVAESAACTTLTGVSFAGATGVMDWTPDYTQAGVYEFKIKGSEGDLTDEKIFTITVTNVDRAPVLAAIADETVAENAAITAVNANDGGDDFDADGDAITYACYYDMAVDGAVATANACGTLTGVIFTAGTGAMTWTPDYTHAGVYEFSIVGDEGNLSDDEIFVITVTNTDRAPVLAAIADETVAENAAITAVNANDGGDDFDADGDAITYTCYYDMTVDGAVATTNACGTLTGVSFTAGTGAMTWTPDYAQAGVYEFSIVGDEGNLTDDEIFVITVTNTDRAPVLAAIADESVAENAAITAVNANDGGDDFDADGDAITYTCYYDMTVDGAVATTNACGTLTGVSFTAGTGAMTWTPDYAQAGVYEFSIVGDEGNLTDDEIFVITVTNTDRAPVLAGIADETVNENSAITAVNANDGGDDFDADNDTITYTCYYDMVVDGAVATTNACGTLTGVSFTAGTGTVTWTPDYAQAGVYEFSIVGDEGNLTDDEIFVITVNNTDRAPILDAIANETVGEGAAITLVDAADGLDDFDIDGDAITYVCYYDSTNDGSVASTNACGTLAGVSFTAGTGIMTWTPDYAQAGTYEFRITGSEGDLTDDELFVITVTNTDRAPVLAAIADEAVAENAAITALNANDGGDDFDADGDAITYVCYYDSVSDGSVAATNACGTLTGVSFTAGTGAMTWTPDYTQAGTYEFRITGSEGDLTDDELFVITVNNADQAPVLAAIADESVAEGVAITAIDANDGGDDFDADNDAITYICYYDNVSDGSVAATSACGTLTGVSFTAGTGAMAWTPNFSQSGTYEFRITGSEGDLTDDELFVITVTGTDLAPVLAAIADETVNENVAIAAVDANDGGDDLDADGDTITYTCYYDNSNDSTVVNTNACGTLTGVSFTAGTGAMTWTPDYSQAGTYEFKITGSEGNLTDDEYFVITVNNVDRAPVLAAIADETVGENTAITAVNANDGGDDFDVDGDTITYQCWYDTSSDANVTETTLCTALTGVLFDAGTGVFNWTPDYVQAGTYEFMIKGDEGDLTDTEIFVITVTNTDRAPVLAAIADETVAENAAITAVNANDGGDDFDADGDAITYACYYDNVSDGSVATTNACGTLTGVSFTAGTGAMTWTPDYAQAGVYEFSIVGDEGNLTDDEIFVITVTNTDRAPVLAAIADETVAENAAITAVNANDGGDDFDADGDAITYTCYYDVVVDGAVATTNACGTLSGVTFTAGTGAMSWTPDYAQAGTYEFSITGSEGDLTDDEFFVITVTNTDRAPVLAAIGDESVAENAAITAVDANDGGDDFDADNDAITYVCYYDNVSDGSVASTNACGTLTGVTFTAGTGAMSWTPDYAQAGTYEFRITGSEGDLTDDEFFVVTVTNTDRAPVLAAIADETVAENAAITAVNANDGGDDFDVDGDAITYTCYYDMAVDGAVATTNACGTLTGVSFTAGTGAMTWTPDYAQAGTYEFSIIGDEGNLTDDEIFVITVTNTDRAPVLAAIADESVAENSAITAVNANDGGDDFDADGDAITYTCYYDMVVDGAVATTNACGTLSGVSFTAGTGAMTWTPDYTQAGTYEFSIIGDEGNLSDDEIFVITVTNTDRAPVLAAIADETVAENAAITAVNANDGGDDFDADNDAITYACYYDNVSDGSVASTNACGTLTGVSFTAGTGTMTWTPDYAQAGTYEFRVTGSEGDLSDDELFVITVTNTDRAPVLADISDETVNENVAITAVNTNDGGDDFDADNDAITYTCYYDQTVDGSVAAALTCASLSGVSFTAATGVMSWTPSYAQAGVYEFRMIGDEGDLTDDEYFVITVNNVDQAPVLAAIADETVSENAAITAINANDGGDDQDADGDAITYTCYYDNTVDGAVATTNACGVLTGVSFTAGTGAMTWTPNFAQSGVYEFKIIGDEGNLTDDEFFVITVNNSDQAPVLAAIADETVAEGAAITAVNANDGGDDFDADNDAITYTCYYDATVDGAVATTNACGTLSGVSFTAGAGAMTWTPGLSSAGQYEFRIIGDEGDLTDDEIFVITVTNSDQPPVLAAIGNKSVNENAALAQIDANDGGDDFDSDSDAITYSCYYDTVVDAVVANTTTCASLSGVTFTAATGILDWTPSYTQAGVYELKMIADEGDLTDVEIFTITVTNIDRAPVLAAIGNQTVNENTAITQIDANDGGDDFDADNDAITYQCWYDSLVDAAVAESTACTTISGLSFTGATGVMDWTPDYTQSGIYEFKIKGSEDDFSDAKIFTITVANVDRAPVLAAIADESVAENAAITAVNANDGGDDFDVDGDTITYVCYYDNVSDGSVAATNACGTLTGVSFAAGTGAMTWTPDYAQAGTYEFSITGSEGDLSDDEIFVITVTNADRAPVLAAIADESVAENAAITAVNANDGGDDFDADNDAITYVCYYDNTNDGSVASTNACGTLTGVTFTGATGAMSWTPDYAQAGTYEFRITGSEGDLTDDELFVITVTNVDRAPVLAAIADETVAENAAIAAVNANDGGDDFDADNDAITYVCYYDNVSDGSVAATNACGTLTGVSFTAGTGAMTWTPDYAQAGTYEFCITGSEGDLTDDEIFVITVTNVDRAPVLADISDETVNENAAIAAVNANDGGDDFDADNDAITYVCYYDNTSDGSVAATNACGTLTGVSFTAGTGAMTWTPTYTQAGTYEFKITGSEGDLTDDEFFVITVNNVDRAPVLDSIADESVGEGIAITLVNTADGLDDFDVDGDAITYTCVYDNTSNGSITGSNACTTISGVNFTDATGVMTWTPDYNQAGTYEFRVTGSEGDLSDEEYFVITVTNTDRAPVLAAIADETVGEGTAIAAIDANDGGDDQDADADTITYSCVYDNTANGSITGSNACTTVTGVSFTAATGVMTWTPDYAQAGTYEFRITGSEGDLSGEEYFVITVTNTDRAPVLADIPDETKAEGAAITQVNANDGGDDFDADNDAITYVCYYDTTVDGSVGTGSTCASLSGASFTAATGVMDWTPSLSSAGQYEFRITGSEGDLTDDEFFVITVTNTDQAPVLAAIADETVAENAAITAVNANDGGDDFDADNDAITYTCYYDNTNDIAVANTNACGTLTGVSFTAGTGAMTWTPDYAQAGTYEFKITGSEGDLVDDEFFVITVTNVDRAPVLATINDETVGENTAITQVNANDGGDDFDADNDAITYQCWYDNSSDANVAETTLCGALSGVLFDTGTGVFNWTPNYAQAGTYEFMIKGNEGDLTDTEIFVITVTNTDRAPVLAAIADDTVAENGVAMVNANDGGDDFDADGDAITYTCYYDQTVDGSVASTNACTAIFGLSFFAGNGIMAWSTDYIHAGVYEFRITGSEGDLTDDEIFVVTVTNTDRAPVVAAIADETVNENTAITAVNANDGGDDFDVDGDAITYTCVFDNTANGSITGSNACTTLTGVSFTGATGAFTWTPDLTQAGVYEFRITGSEGDLSDDEYFVITVTQPILAITPDPKTGMDIVSSTVAGANVEFTVTNSGTGSSATLNAPVLAGANAANFEVTTNNCTGTLAPAATCTIFVRPKGSTDATYAATLTIGDGNVSSNAAALSGQRNDIIIY